MPNLLLYTDRNGQHQVEQLSCPACKGVFLVHRDMLGVEGPDGPADLVRDEYVLLPRTSAKPAPPPEVPEAYRRLYAQAALILSDSPMGSAALARRCLQQILREELKAPKGDLKNEIDWTLANAGLPAYVTESLHELREVGNYAAHPNKSTATGDWVEVEPGEAEWTLDTLDELFAHLWVRPAQTAARKAAWDARKA